MLLMSLINFDTIQYLCNNMVSSKFAYSFLAFAFLLLRKALGVDDPLFHFCSSSSGNFASNGPYPTNLNKLIHYLNYRTPPTGFGKGVISLGGQNPNNQSIYGLALCRGDTSISDCKTCIADASNEILKRCPYNKAAIIWYDNCLFKYSNTEFFGRIDNQNKFYMWNLRVVNEPVDFNRKTMELLTQLAKEAYGSPKLYAVGEMKLEEKKLYGLTQCTRDLSTVDCNKCLNGIIGELPNCCDGKEGGRVVSGSCNIRYEIYPFVNASSSLAPGTN